MAKRRETSGLVRMKRGIEAGDLRQLRPALEQQADRREVVRLMQRRERHELFEHGDDIGVEPHRLRILHAAVHHPVADRRELEAAAVRRAENRRDAPRRPSWPRLTPSPQRLLGERRAVRVRARRTVATVCRPSIWPRTTGSSAPSRSAKSEELDAGRAGVQNEDRVAHRVTRPSRHRSRRAFATSAATAQEARRVDHANRRGW